MAHMGLNSYLQQVERCIEDADGETLAELVSFRHPHVHSSKLQSPDFESQCQAYLESPYDEMVAAHIRCAGAVRGGDFVDSFACQTVVVQSFLRAFQTQKEENWALPVLKVVTLDLRLFAIQAEAGKASRGHSKPGELLEKAADHIMSCFRVCVSDMRTSEELTKRWATLALVNQLFKIYFKINKLPLCKPLIRAIDSSSLKDRFSLAQTVTYKFFVGRKAMFDSEFRTAANYLQFAFDNCYPTSNNNKWLILVYLIPVKMLLGHMPSARLLTEYRLPQFIDVAKAVSQGNMRLLSATLQKNEVFFIHFRIYLILEKLKIIAYRNLFKKVSLLQKTHLILLASFETALKFSGDEDTDIDEVQCIIANLIDKVSPSP
ncbi:PCI domain-containing protein 2 [Geodia barretti]|uniref:CSN12-like protein n=1 Tax=Geodia barretti TaxID=519541 RepID=A0AA35SGB7_GEOBA|nr:PCI domain-containing protein 2 [Geodia barretti]